MFAGDFASDMVANGARNDAIKLRHALDQANATIDEMNLANAANLGVRYALANQLAIVDPENPLLNDVSLVERLKAAAESAFKIAGQHFDAARDVGRSFKIPGRERASSPKQLVQPPKLLKDDPEQLKDAYAGVIALRDAIAAQLMRLDPDNPLLKDILLLDRVRKCGIAAYRINGENFDSAREAGRTFQIPGR
ncbi:hypothetical protein [Polaromonas sp.]|uniref:hypothetical protein n=1 Tax=Polaromonas sp. TaxID=1869339 RepID=UPI00352BC8B6